MLLHRFLVAIVGAPLLLLIIIKGGSIGNSILFGAISAIGLFEYYRMVFKDDTVSRNLYILLGLLLYAGWNFAMFADYLDQAVIAALVLGFLASFLYILLFRPEPIETVGARAAAGFFGLAYVPLLFFFFVLLQAFEGGWRYLILALIIIWMSDTGAYFAGRFLGRHKLYPRVSPKKTWEGSIGGTLAAVAGAFIGAAILGIDWSPLHLTGLSLIMAIVGAMGDLCESLLKRSYGVKDSGNILPGHGGVLDRFDALLFSVPLMYYYIVVFGLM